MDMLYYKLMPIYVSLSLVINDCVRDIKENRSMNIYTTWVSYIELYVYFALISVFKIEHRSVKVLYNM